MRWWTTVGRASVPVLGSGNGKSIVLGRTAGSGRLSILPWRVRRRRSRRLIDGYTWKGVLMADDDVVVDSSAGRRLIHSLVIVVVVVL